MIKQKENKLLVLVQSFGGYSLLTSIGICALCRTVRDIACAVTLANTTNAVLTGGKVWLHVLSMLAAMFVNIPINMAYNYFTEQYTAHVRSQAMKAIGDKLPKLPAAWLENQSTGGLISTSTSDVDQYLLWTQRGFALFLQQSAYYIGAICYALSQNVELTLLAFSIVIFLVPLFGSMAKPLKRITDSQRVQAAEAMARMQEVLTDPEQVKAYSLKEAMAKRVEAALKNQMYAQQKAGFYQGLSQSFGNISSYLPGFIAAGVGVLFLLRGQVTAGYLVSFVQMAVQRFSGLIPQLAGAAALTRQAGASADRICALLNEKNEREDGQIALPDCPLEPVFEADHISFGYGEGDLVLKDVSFQIEKGTTVAFVGASGSGKSTILSLLMGVYEPLKGELRCMGRPISQWNLNALRGQIAPVFQNTFLFPATVGENLCGKVVGDLCRALGCQIKTAQFKSIFRKGQKTAIHLTARL